MPKLKTRIRLSSFRFKVPAVRNQYIGERAIATREHPAVARGGDNAVTFSNQQLCVVNV